MKMVGERPLNALMDGLADVRKAKVKEAFEKATVKCKAGGPPKPAAAPPPAKAAPKKKAPAPKKADSASASPPVDEEVPPPSEDKPLKKPPARLLVCGNCYSFSAYSIVVFRQRSLLRQQPVVRREVGRPALPQQRSL